MLAESISTWCYTNFDLYHIVSRTLSISQIFPALQLSRYLMKNLVIPPPTALACVQPVANYMLRLPCMSAEILECLAGRAVAMLANGLETLSLRELNELSKASLRGTLLSM